jgi:hypothetical protein
MRGDAVRYGRSPAERQAATDEMLRVIASSPGELAPVFQAILANGTRLCEAKFGILVTKGGHDDFPQIIEYRPAAQIRWQPDA